MTFGGRACTGSIGPDGRITCDIAERSEDDENVSDLSIDGEGGTSD